MTAIAMEAQLFALWRGRTSLARAGGFWHSFGTHCDRDGCGDQFRLVPENEKAPHLRGFLTKRLKGLEPSTFC
ncbi:MAG: hypothetical protein ACRDUX_26625, partial [Mycobacterium sp.]